MYRLSRILTAAVPAVLLALGGCSVFSSGKTYRLTAAPEVPGASGEVKYSKTDNDNTKVKVEVKHLAPPMKVSPGAMTYVVWVQPMDQTARPTNLGGLKVDDELTGKLEATTPHENFDLYVTAEPDPRVMEPKGNRVLWAQVRR